MSVATMKKVKASVPLNKPEAIPANHRLAIEAPADGELSRQNREAIEAYWQDVVAVLTDESELLEDRRKLLASGMDMPVRQVLNQSHEMQMRKSMIEDRQLKVLMQKFALAAKLLPDYKRIAEEKRIEMEAAIDEQVSLLRESGVCEMSWGAIHEGTAQRLRVLAAERPASLAARAKMNVAEGELSTMESWGEVGKRGINRQTKISIPFPASKGDEAVIARLAGLVDAPVVKQNGWHEETVIRGPRRIPTVMATPIMGRLPTDEELLNIVQIR